MCARLVWMSTFRWEEEGVCVWMCKGPSEILFVYNIIDSLNLNFFRCHTISKAIIKVLWSLFKTIKPLLCSRNLKYLNKHNPKCMTFIFDFPWFRALCTIFAIQFQIILLYCVFLSQSQSDFAAYSWRFLFTWKTP